jgi:cellulose biosynthesis protein BcsQ
MKGGVGKTSTSVNLAYNFAKMGYRTLLWDLDSQGASSFYFNIKPKVKNIKKLLNSKAGLDEYIKGSDYVNLDIMPADFAYRNFDIMLDEAKKSKKRLKLSLQEVSGDYDIVILDSPPTISALSSGIFYASDIILNPMVPTTLSALTYNQLIEHLKDEPSNLNKLYAFFSMVDVRKALHKSTMISFKDDMRFLKQLIPYSAVIERMGVHRAPVGVFETNSIASRCYHDLASEVIAKLLAPRKLS